MDLSDPTRAVTPTLDGPVLAVLARAGKPLTVGEIAQQAARGSEIGIRRAVARLVGQGTVTATQMGRNQVLELNREHLAAGAAILLADLRLELWRRLRDLIGGWSEPASYACVFGSAARGDGDEGSDIDIVVVHRPDPEDIRQEDVSRLFPSLREVWARNSRAPEQAAQWQAQVDDLHGKTLQWTGNVAQVVDLGLPRWLALPDDEPTLFGAITRDQVVLVDAMNAKRPLPVWTSSGA